jgi:type II secretory pathway pseudopilin PulG
MTRSHRSSAAGFVFVELLVILAIISLLTAIALPKYQEVKKRAVAARAIGALTVVRGAAYAANEATGHWPAGAASGQMPPAMRSYLPNGFQFAEGEFSLAWRSTTYSVGGLPQSAQMVEVSTADPFVCQAIGRLLGGERNSELLTSCTGTRGVVTLFVEN